MPPSITEPPDYCEYAGGACDQEFTGVQRSRGLFLYASQPVQIAATIEGAVAALRLANGGPPWRTWRDLGIVGQIIFCTICKHLRFAELAVADVTTLNFNLMFEIGFALGLEIPLIPIRD